MCMLRMCLVVRLVKAEPFRLCASRSSSSDRAVHRESGSSGTDSGSHNTGSLVHGRSEKRRLAATAIAAAFGMYEKTCLAFQF